MSDERQTSIKLNRASGVGAVMASFVMPVLVCALSVLYFSDFEDARQFASRLFVFLPFAFLAFFNMKLALGLALVTCGWFEWPTLAFELRNQFLLDGVILGMALGTLMRSAKTRREAKQVGEISAPMLLDPFFLVLCVLSILGAFYLSATQGALATTNGQVRRWFFAMQEWGFLWDEGSSPVHSEMVVVGWMTYAIAIWTVNQIRSCWKVGLHFLAGSLSLGMIPVVVVGTFQYIDPWCFLRNSFSVDTGGTFQNGNHLSFYCGIVALVVATNLLFCNERNSEAGPRPLSYRQRTIYFLVAFFVALWGMYIGNGRTAQIAFAFGMTPLLGLWLFVSGSHGKSRVDKRYGPRRFGLVLLWASALSGAALVLLEVPIALGLLRYVPKELSFATHILESTGRKELLAGATRHLVDNPWFGHGLGLFYRTSEMKLPQHNLWLALSSEMGIPAAILVVISLAFSTAIWLRAISRELKMKSYESLIALREVWLVLPLIAYFSLGSLMDTFFSYRSLGFVFLIPFHIALSYLPRFSLAELRRVDVFARLLFALCLAFGLSYGIWSGRSDAFEAATRTSYAVPPGQCFVLDFTPLSHENWRCRTSTTIAIDPGKQAERYLQPQQNWQGMLCVCNPGAVSNSSNQDLGSQVDVTRTDCLGRAIHYSNERFDATVKLRSVAANLDCAKLVVGGY